MLISTIVMAAIAAVVLGLAYHRGDGTHMQGLKDGGNMLVQLAPLLIFAFIIAGTLPLIIPRELIAQWIGAESGIKGIFIGSVVGGLLPGGPAVSLPILAGFLHVGAGVGTLVAMITGWSLLAFSRLPLEVGIMGWKFTLIRLACTFLLAPLAGMIAQRLFSHVALS
jgi:uncharacterized membrane protein YraQ (UPF0718 family)